MVKTICEGNEFIIDYLYRGSIVNHRAFFLDDLIYVDIVCKSYVSILKLTRNSFDQVKNDYPSFDIMQKKYVMKILSNKKRFYLDYIIEPLPFKNETK